MNSRTVLGFSGMVLAVAALLVIGTKVLAIYGWIDGEPSFMWETVALLCISTIIIYFFLQKGNRRDPLEFVKSFLLSVVLKIVLGGIFIVILIKLDAPGANANALFFLISYFLFTGLEVTMLAKIKNGG
jgi:hypothetical protein